MQIYKTFYSRFARRFCLMALLAGTSLAASAQTLADYTLRYDTASFQTIVGTDGCHSLPAAVGDNGYDYLQMPFAFPFGEDVVAQGTRVAASSNGFLWFGNSVLGDYGYSQYGSSSTTERMVVPFVQADGFCNGGVWYADTTDADGRVLVFEFRGITSYGGRSDNTNDVNYQVLLREDGTIAVHFDSSSFTHTANRTLTIINTAADRLALTGSWTAPVMASPSSVPVVEGVPVPGARYTLARPAGYCARPQSLAVDSVGSSWIALSWQGDASDYLLYWTATATAWTDSAIVAGHDTLIAGLAPSTPYWFALCSRCGDTLFSTYVQAQGRTACLPIDDLPYTEDFESFDIGQSGWNPCWHRFFRESNGQLTEGNPIGTSDAHEGERSMRLYAHPTYRQWTLFALPAVDGYALSQLQLSFFYRTNRAAGNLLVVGVMENLSDTGSFVPVDTVEVSGTEWTLAEVDLGSYSGAGTCVAVRYSTSVTTGYETYYCYIDDLMLSLLPACGKPQGVSVGSIAPQSAVATIADTAFATGDQYVVVLTSESDTLNDVVSSLTYNLSGLRPGTGYALSVAKLCADGTMTRTVSTRFTTTCESLTHDDMPYTENFDSYETGQGGFTNPCWTVSNFHPSGNYPMPSSYTYHGSTGKSLYFYANRQYEGQFVALPAVDYINDLVLHFWSYCTNSVSRLEVGYMSDPHDTTTFTSLITVVPSTSGWEEHEVTFASVTDSNLCVAFRNYHTSLATGYNICIDDVELSVAPSCLRPTAVAVDSVWADSLHVVVSDPAQQLNYRVWIGEQDSLDVQDSSFVIAGLLPGTTYALRVATLCDDGTLTPTVGTSATTLCATLDSTALPWSESFEGWQAGIYAPFNPCWQRHYGAGDLWSPYPEAKVRVMAEGATKALELRSEHTWSDGALQAMAVLPEFDVDVRRLTVSLRMKFYSATASDDDFLEVGVAADATDPTTFVSVDTVRHPGNNQYASYECALRGSSLTSGHVALRYHYGVYNDYNMVYVDSIALVLGELVVEEDTCAMPTDVAVDSIGQTTAVVSWASTGDAGRWEVRLGDADVHETTDTFFVATGLDAGTTYSVAVRTLCSDDLASDWTVTLTFTTLEAEQPAVCAAPTQLAVAAITETTARLSWQPGGDEQRWEVQCGSVTLPAEDHSSFMLEGLEESTTYTVRVRALCDDGGSSEWSEPAVFRTLDHVGIGHVENGTMGLWPNPASTVVTVGGLQAGDVVMLLGANGCRYGTWTVGEHDLTIDVAALPRGTYFVKSVSQAGTSVGKLIVQ